MSSSLTELNLHLNVNQSLNGDKWWKNAVVYQIYPRSFADSNGDGIGDLQGIISRLDYLETLGIDVIWLSPIYSSPQKDNGYDISDYQAIDPVFGKISDFDELITQIHNRGIKLVMDLVVNHTSDQHPWFVESASSIDNPKRDWYWWRKPRESFVGGEFGAEPTNWGSFFSGPAWTFDEASKEYYLHLFAKEQPDLNWENPEVREAIYKMMGWWLDRGVDGFRMDVINLISKDPALPDGQRASGALFGNGFPHFSYGPRIHEFLAEMHQKVFLERDEDYLKIGEMPGVTVEQARLFTDPARNELDMVFQFEHVGLDHGSEGKWDGKKLVLREMKESFQRWQIGLADKGWNSLYWSNHDQPRAVSRFGNDKKYWIESTKLLGAVLHLQRGTPFIYQGEEIGMTNVPFENIEDFRDIETLNRFAELMDDLSTGETAVLPALRRSSRDNARTPMQWDSHPNAGFTKGTPWIGTNSNFPWINVKNQVEDSNSIYEFYRSLIQLRHDEPVVVFGDFKMLAVEHDSLFAYTRTTSDASIVLLANFSDCSLALSEVIDFVSEDWADSGLILRNYEVASVPAVEPLRPWELRVLKK